MKRVFSLASNSRNSNTEILKYTNIRVSVDEMGVPDDFSNGNEVEDGLRATGNGGLEGVRVFIVLEGW